MTSVIQVKDLQTNNLLSLESTVIN